MGFVVSGKITELQGNVNKQVISAAATWRYKGSRATCLLHMPNAINKYRVIQNDCRGFNDLSYTIHLRQDYMYFLFNRTTLQVFVTYLTGKPDP